MQRNLDFSAGAPHSAQGFGVQQNTLSGGRTGVSLSHFGGLSEILWWGKKPEAAPSCFFAGNPASAYQRCFRAQLLVGDDPYNLEFARTSHFPFGYRSHFAVPEKGVAVIHRLTLLNNELVFSVEVKANASRLPLRLRFEHHEYSRKNAPVRQWSDWERSGGSGGWALVAEDRVPPEQWREIEADARRQQEAFRSPGNGFVNQPRIHLGISRSSTRIEFFGTRPLDLRRTHSGRSILTTNRAQTPRAAFPIRRRGVRRRGPGAELAGCAFRRRSLLAPVLRALCSPHYCRRTGSRCGIRCGAP